MAVKKIAISSDTELDAELLEARVRRRPPWTWVSGWIGDRLRRRRLDALVKEYEAEFGAFSDEEMADSGCGRCRRRRLRWSSTHGHPDH